MLLQGGTWYGGSQQGERKPRSWALSWHHSALWEMPEGPQGGGGSGGVGAEHGAGSAGVGYPPVKQSSQHSGGRRWSSEELDVSSLGPVSQDSAASAVF